MLLVLYVMFVLFVWVSLRIGRAAMGSRAAMLVISVVGGIVAIGYGALGLWLLQRQLEPDDRGLIPAVMGAGLFAGAVLLLAGLVISSRSPRARSARVAGYALMAAVMLIPNWSIILLAPLLGIAAGVCQPFTRPDEEEHEKEHGPEDAASGFAVARR